MTFRVIAGSGHCGTMWLAKVLNSVPGQRWTHEMRKAMTGMGWQKADALRPDDPVFDEYWSWVRHEMLYYDVLGDSNSWSPEQVPYIDEFIIPIEQVIYLTRDKDKQLHSITNHSPVWSRKWWPKVATDRLETYAAIAGRDDVNNPRLLVDANDFMPDWLREMGLNVVTYSLEELTTDVKKLRELAPLTDVELVAWQNRDINRKVPA